MNFNMECPKCGKNKWELKYSGQSENKLNTKTKNVGCYVGLYGVINIKCKCGYEQEIHIGSD